MTEVTTPHPGHHWVGLARCHTAGALQWKDDGIQAGSSRCTAGLCVAITPGFVKERPLHARPCWACD